MRARFNRSICPNPHGNGYTFANLLLLICATIAAAVWDNGDYKIFKKFDS
jgi:hypothetical protein